MLGSGTRVSINLVSNPQGQPGQVIALPRGSGTGESISFTEQVLWRILILHRSGYEFWVRAR